ncbi:MAG: NUDIX domain-containing protein [Phycisphaerales bacterium]|nr:NUDIX domain-containing protein [Phycisphaerales bacterium]
MKIPYKIAVLVYIFNEAGELLLLHRKKFPNKDLYSPIGGKLEQDIGESPYACALREVREEIGVELALGDVRLLGIVSERGYASGGVAEGGGASHWLMFCFEVVRALDVAEREFEEGRLEWVGAAAVEGLEIPKTDREVIWPLVREHSVMMGGGDSAGIFSVHIDCTDVDAFVVTHEKVKSHKVKS